MGDQVPFALAPALVTDQVLDYSTKEGASLYKSGIKALDEDNPFGCDAEGLRVFLSRLSDRSRQMGWHVVLNVPDDPADPTGAHKSLLTRYGEIPMTRIRQFVEAHVAGRTSRAAQDSAMIHQCLTASLSASGYAKVSLFAEEYTVNGIPDGLLFLRVIIRESHLDTNATSTQIREALTRLDDSMGQYGSDIARFNEHVKSLVLSLAARGETSSDLLVNLLKGYKACSDTEFVAYVRQKESDYEEGKPLTYQQLMSLALNKYKTRVTNKEWNAPSADQQKILALEAELKKLKSAKGKAPKPPTPKAKAPKPDDPKKPQAKEKATGKKQKPDWMLKEPTAQEKASGSKKTVSGKQYHWCPHHKAWTRHSPAECRLKSAQTGSGQPNARPATDSSNQQRTLQLSQAIAALIQEE